MAKVTGQQRRGHSVAEQTARDTVSPAVRSAGDACCAAFTIVELIVVITVIVLILAIAVPGLSAMNAEARLKAAAQTTSGCLTRAYYQALADVNMTAVRFVPESWVRQDSDAEQTEATTSKRQLLLTYSYAGISYDEDNPIEDQVEYHEYFVRRSGVEPTRLPADVWATPLEALSTAPARLGEDGLYYPNLGRDFVTAGTVGDFYYNADESDGANNFLNADDFLVVIDPDSGIIGGTPQPYPLRAYSPIDGYELDHAPGTNGQPFQRFGFAGVVLYRREAFLGLGSDASGEERQQWLRDNGQPYMAHRYSGGLNAGLQHPE